MHLDELVTILQYYCWGRNLKIGMIKTTCGWGPPTPTHVTQYSIQIQDVNWVICMWALVCMQEHSIWHLHLSFLLFCVHVKTKKKNMQHWLSYLRHKLILSNLSDHKKDKTNTSWSTFNNLQGGSFNLLIDLTMKNFFSSFCGWNGLTRVGIVVFDVA